MSRINLRLLAKSLDALGYNYILCTNGQEALEMFQHPESVIDAVIIDMSMPIMGTGILVLHLFLTIITNKSCEQKQMESERQKRCESLKPHVLQMALHSGRVRQSSLSPATR